MTSPTSARPAGDLATPTPPRLTRWPERLLLRLSRPPAASDWTGCGEHWTDANALEILRSAFPHFDRLIEGRDVLDFGCGEGFQTLAIRRAGARQAIGVDANASALSRAEGRWAAAGGPPGVGFIPALAGAHRGAFDVVLSQNSMEHFPDPAATLRVMVSALRPDGVLLITFGAPWLSPYGAHMYFFTRIPWVQLVFSERTVMTVRSRFRPDGARRYEEVPGGLNRMTARKFAGLVRELGLRPTYQHFECVKRLDFLARIPLVRELFINRISCMLALPDGGNSGLGGSEA